MFDSRGSKAQHRSPDRRRRRGQALVEFALVLPLFLLILAAIVDFGMGLSSTITLGNAAREGARLGTVNPSPSAIEARVRSVAAGLDLTELTVTSSCLTKSGGSYTTCPGTWQPGDSMVVNASYRYHVIWPLAFGTVIPLSSSVEMRVE
jgi:Flp pilus assembly protein TadG